MSRFPDLPRLDCHAHVAPDVTAEQVRRLGDAVVFAVTRTLDEGYAALRRRDERLIWGWGAHPAVAEGLDAFTVERAAALARRLPLVGEVGLDRRGPGDRQQEVFAAALHAAQDQPVLISVHSTGRTAAVLESIRTCPHQGIVLHWFLGTPKEITEAANAGCYFSVNAAMPAEKLSRIPPERMLPETDFPASRRRQGGQMPGDTEAVEEMVAQCMGSSPEEVRWMFWANLRKISVLTGAIDRYPDFVSDILLSI